MISIAIIEDEKVYFEQLKKYIERFGKEHQRVFQVEIFSNGLNFLDSCEMSYDIVFMDIVMPFMNGLEVAKRFREKNKNSCLIFITNMEQYAIKGYEVNALDFLVKPVTYELFAIKLEKALSYVRKEEMYCISIPNGVKKVKFSDIIYIESDKHYVYFYTVEGEFRTRDSMRNIEQVFRQQVFASVNQSIMINLAYVDSLAGNEISVHGGRVFLLSRKYKKEFVAKMYEYIGDVQ